MACLAEPICCAARSERQRRAVRGPGGRRPRSLWLAAALLFALSIPAAPRAPAADEPPDAASGSVADLGAIERAFEQVAARVAPTVVGIRAQRRYAAALPVGDAGGENAAVEQLVVVNASGTIISAEGLILTNEHVVQAAVDVEVLFHDGRKLPATVVSSDPRSDLAVISVARSGLSPATLGDWEAVTRGQWAIVIGNPFGLGSDGKLSVSVGVIANLDRQLPGLGEVDDRFYSDMVQVTAPINPGNSGGPLLNIRGELIGIVTAMHTRAPADDGVGFAIPLTPAKRRLIDILRQGRRIEYGYLGVSVRLPEPAERTAAGLGAERGVIVQQVEPDGPAAAADLRVGDLLFAYAQSPVTGPAQLAELIGQTPVGTRVGLELLRAGQPLDLEATIDRRDISRVSWMRGGAVFWRGLRLADLTDDSRRRMRVTGDAPRGVVVIEVDADSPAGRAGVQAGNVIEAVGGQPVHGALDFLARVRDAAGALEVAIRERGTRTIAP